MSPKAGGAPEAIAIPMHSGKATRRTTIEAMKSRANGDLPDDAEAGALLAVDMSSACEGEGETLAPMRCSTSFDATDVRSLSIIAPPPPIRLPPCDVVPRKNRDSGNFDLVAITVLITRFSRSVSIRFEDNTTRAALVPVFYVLCGCAIETGDLVEVNMCFGLLWNGLQGVSELWQAHEGSRAAQVHVVSVTVLDHLDVEPR